MGKWVAKGVASDVKDFTIEGQGKNLCNSPLIHRSLPRNMAAIIIVVKGAVKSKVIASPRGIKVTQLTAQVTITPPKMPVFNIFLNLNFRSNFLSNLIFWNDKYVFKMGPFVNYVSIFLPIFDQVSTLSKHVY